MTILLRRMVEDDVDGVVRCFESCYGRTYIAEFYDPAWMREQVRSGRMRSVVAVDDRAGIVGHMALKIVNEGSRACEAGATVVDPAFRRLGLMGRMGRRISELCLSEGFVGMVNEPTTAHLLMQRRSTASGGVETGIMLELVPASTEFLEFDVPPGRGAVTVVYQPIAEAPAREVFVPGVYRDLVQRLYAEIGLRRNIVGTTGGAANELPPAGEVDETVSTQHRLRRLFVMRVGADLGQCIDREPSSPIEITHVDLCLDDPGVETAVRSLRQRGFFYCALLPEFGRTDLLRLQRLEAPGPMAFSPLLANEGAKRLLAFMREEQT